MARALRAAWLWAPLAVLLALAAPSIGFMLPNYQSDLGENYEPLKTLKFAASAGADFHKYGPMTSFLLLPPYAASLAWWRLNGTFTRPSGDFPYGLEEPLAQLSVLVLEARLLFLALFVAGCAFLLVELVRLGLRRGAVSVAFLLLVATSYAAGMYAANDRPDGPAFAFVAASLAMYVRLLRTGPSLWPACLMSLFAVCAISAKELAGPLFVLPYLGLGAHFARQSRGDAAARRAFVRTSAASVATGVLSYLALNVVYAPSTWLARMQHWLGGGGTSKEVWLGTEAPTLASVALDHLGSFLNVLGPAGMIATPAALLALAWLRPRHAGLLLLPFASILLLGLLPLGFPGERFYMLASAALVPPVALGLDALWSRTPAGAARRALLGATAFGVAANFVLGTFAWHQLEGLMPRAVERSLEAVPMGEGALNVFDTFSHPPDKSRLAWLGYRVDGRSIQEISADAPEGRPARIYVSEAYLIFLEQAKANPARTEMLREVGSFEAARWEGLEALGYRRVARLETDTPAWFPFDWVPGVRAWRGMNALLIYDKVETERAPEPT